MYGFFQSVHLILLPVSAHFLIINQVSERFVHQFSGFPANSAQKQKYRMKQDGKVDTLAVFFCDSFYHIRGTNILAVLRIESALFLISNH